ncbi:MAG TPA: efflux RND transporter permease subunit [Bryobacteraceae bacterium]|nr:efflux RND transporter permease subunit [Bryobacteraceae bacterium]
MSPSRIFILRPVATSLLMAGILLVGLVSYTQLPVSALPEVAFPTIQVVTFYPGAGPQVMATSVTAPLERWFGQMPGLAQMTSTSSGGSSVITLQFNLALDIDVAEQEVQQSINTANTYLPTDLPTPPIYRKINPAEAPILTLALTSDVLPLPNVEDLADTHLAPKLSELPGVGLVSITGGQKPSVHIQANPTQLASLGLNLEDVRTAISAANVNLAKGSFSGPHQAYTIEANDQLLSADDYKPLIIAYRNGAPIKLTDVADIVEEPEDINEAAWMNTTPAVILNIQRQPGANTIAVADSIKALLPTLTALLPASIRAVVLTDQTVTIRASVEDVEFELVLTIGLVVLVIFLFLRSLRATVIPSVAVPLSLIGTFAVMYLLGYSLNNLTLMALTISTGFVVDDAIVMIENISRFVEQGDPPLEAALKGAEQIGFTIISLTVSLIAVLIPLLFMGDIVGRLFREFAVTLAVTILVSAAVSLTLTPMMSARLLRHTPEAQQGRFYRRSESAFNWVIGKYGRTLEWALDRQVFMMLLFGAALALTVILFLIIPKGFFPVQDTGAIQGITVADQDISFAAMSRQQEALAKVVLEDPAVESLSSFIGVDGTNTTLNSGHLLINLKPLSVRGISASDVIRRLEPNVEKVPGIALYMQPVQNITVDTHISRAQYQYSLEDPNQEELNEIAPRLVERLKRLEQLREVASDQQNAGLRTSLVYNRDTASRLGLTASMIDQTLYDAYGQRQISTIFTDLNQYHVVLELKHDFKQHPIDLHDLYVRTAVAVSSTSGAATGGAGTVAGGTATTQAFGPSSSSAAAAASSTLTTSNTSTSTAPTTTTLGSRASATANTTLSVTLPVSSPATSLLAASGTATSSSAATAATSGTATTTGASTATSTTTLPSGGAGAASGSAHLNGAPATSTQAFPNNQQVPLSTFATFRQSSSPIAINHQGQFPVVTFSFNLGPRVSLGEAVDEVERTVREMKLPVSVEGAFQGSAAAFEASLVREPVLILAAVVTVYIVLGVLYESYIHPLTILSTLPSAGVGALIALMLTGEDFSFIALIGLVLLIGIVKKNAIMMIDFALEAEREQQMPPREAIFQASLLRFRPIMMTTMAALLGALPLALGSGMGAELRRPLGISIIGGLMISQLLTLYTTPVIYLQMGRMATWVRRRRR